jgi:hypothetical protein
MRCLNEDEVRPGIACELRKPAHRVFLADLSCQLPRGHGNVNQAAVDGALGEVMHEPAQVVQDGFVVQVLDDWRGHAVASVTAMGKQRHMVTIGIKKAGLELTDQLPCGVASCGVSSLPVAAARPDPHPRPGSRLVFWIVCLCSEAYLTYLRGSGGSGHPGTAAHSLAEHVEHVLALTVGRGEAGA